MATGKARIHLIKKAISVAMEDVYSDNQPLILSIINQLEDVNISVQNQNE